MTTAELVKERNRLADALQVVNKTPHILAYLKANDPKALEQIRRALDVCTECGQGEPGVQGYEHKAGCSLWEDDDYYDAWPFEGYPLDEATE